MTKIADRYLTVDPWAIIEHGFHPDRSRVSESIFALGNEYMGVRGYFDEGYGGDSLRGSYLNGLYEETPIYHPQHFKGLATRCCFLVNAVDWLYMRIELDGETLDLHSSTISDFTRRLDLKTGTLTREFTWETASGQRLKLTFLRFLSMVTPQLGGQRITAEALNFCGEITIQSGLDFSPRHEHFDINPWHIRRQEADTPLTAVLGQTEQTGQYLFSAFRLESATPLETRHIEAPLFTGVTFTLSLEQGAPVNVEKLVVNYAEKDTARPADQVWAQGIAQAHQLTDITFNAALEAHRAYWQNVWDTLDITIDGDPENQQGIRFCIFQLHQTYHGVDPSLNVAAKGLTGEIYFGWTFWDTETYCLPFYLFNNPKAARNLLGYRYRTLPQAVERAAQLDCQGARYPMGTIDGTESVGVWQHGDLEIHVSVAVAYGIWHYVNLTGDIDFLYTEGIEMLLQICRFYASRGDWSPTTGEFGFWGVMGADEFCMMVHNNTYTNVMARHTFDYTLATAHDMQHTAPQQWQAVCAKVALDPQELDDWAHKSQKMRVLFDPQKNLFEQHDGYFDLPHVDVKAIPHTQFPIYKHWAYDRIFRNDMIKQPDVLLLPFFFSHNYSLAVKRANYEFYEPRCVHESSLSPAIHSILAAELGKHDEAYRYALHASRLDLDDYNRNTHEGLHTTSMAAAWMNVVYGFGGMRSDGDVLSFTPSLPAAWEAFSFRILYRDSLLQAEVTQYAVEYRVLNGPPVQISVFDQLYTVDTNGITVDLPHERRE